MARFTLSARTELPPDFDDKIVSPSAWLVALFRLRLLALMVSLPPSDYADTQVLCIAKYFVSYHRFVGLSRKK
jgi:hypothetical protein